MQRKTPNKDRAEMALQLRNRLKEIIEFADKEADEKVGYHGQLQAEEVLFEERKGKSKSQ